MSSPKMCGRYNREKALLAAKSCVPIPLQLKMLIISALKTHSASKSDCVTGMKMQQLQLVYPWERPTL